MKTTMNMICFSLVLKLTSVLPGNVVVSLFFWLQVSDVSFPSRYYYKISMTLAGDTPHIRRYPVQAAQSGSTTAPAAIVC